MQTEQHHGETRRYQHTGVTASSVRFRVFLQPNKSNSFAFRGLVVVCQSVKVISNGDGWRLITFSPPRASMSGGHLRIRLPQPIGARPRADGRRARPMGAQRHPGKSPLPLALPSFSVPVPRPDEPKRGFKKMGMFHRPAGGSPALLCAKVRKKKNLEDIHILEGEFFILLFACSSREEEEALEASTR